MSGCMLAWAKTVDLRAKQAKHKGSLREGEDMKTIETRLLPTSLAKQDLDRLRPAPFHPRAVSQRICACLLHPHLCFLQKAERRITTITKCLCCNFDFLTFLMCIFIFPGERARATNQATNLVPDSVETLTERKAAHRAKCPISWET